MNPHLMGGQSPVAIFFDLDGTLVDSIPDLAYALDRMLQALGLTAAGEDHARLWVGNGARKLVLRALSHALQQAEENISEAYLQQAHQLFLQYYAGAADKSRLYPHVADVLRTLQRRGIRLALITNKPQQFVPALLQHLGLDGLFEHIVCGDTLPQQKPSPEPLLYVLQAMQLSAAEVLMVGDSANDILAAQAAGMCSVCVTYGYNHGDDPYQLPADAHIDHFSALLDII